MTTLTTPRGIVVLPNGQWVLQNDTHHSRWAEQVGRVTHDVWMLERVLPLMKPGQTVIDCGALFGDHTAAYAEAVGEHGRVYAFEPNGLAMQCLVHNLGPFGTVARCINCAVGDKSESAKLLTSSNAGASFVGPKGTEYAMVLRIDDVVRPPVHYIKFDIEGFELKALEGARGIIEECHPAIVIEINKGALERQGDTPDQIYDFFADLLYAKPTCLQGYSEREWPDKPQFDLIYK